MIFAVLLKWVVENTRMGVFSIDLTIQPTHGRSVYVHGLHWIQDNRYVKHIQKQTCISAASDIE